MPGQRRQRIEGADQRRNGDQFIDQPGQAERHENHGMSQLIAAFADAAQFVDQIEKTEEREERHKDQENGPQGFAHQIALVEAQAKHQARLRCHGICTTVRL